MTAIALPPLSRPVRAAIAEARRHMLSRRLRVTALVLLLATAGILIGVNGNAGNSSSALQLAPVGGSAGMPATFVASRYVSAQQGLTNGQVFELDLVNSRTGSVERPLAQFGGGSFLANRTAAFYANGLRGIEEVPLAGGHPRVLVNGVIPNALALSPDGTHLAWMTDGPATSTVSLPGTDGIRYGASYPASVIVTDMSLSSSVRHSWSLSTGARIDDGEVIRSDTTAIGWAGNSELAVTTGFSLASLNFCSVGTQCSPRTSQTIRLPAPSLTLIATNKPATATTSLTVPAPSGFECRLQGGPFDGAAESSFLDVHGFLASTSRPDQLLAYGGGSNCGLGTTNVGPSSARSSGADLLLLTVSGDRVNVSNVGSLPPGVLPTALDNDGKDLLVVGAFTSGPDNGATFLARVASGDRLVYVDKVPQNDLLGEAWNGATW